MEVEEVQAQQPCKFPRIGNGGRGSSSVAKNPDEEDNNGGGGREIKTTNRLNGWHHSRIIRVSRASGGKDRHSKVWTSKGLRDRRVRLSVSTAIQFYDLQDRLGYDQPSKAVEWLIKSAADAIAELPSLNTDSFPDTPKQLSDEKRGSSEHGFDSVELDVDDHPNYHHQMNQTTQSQQLCLSKSACSSTSETSKGSGLSLSRPDTRVNRVKAARERARERTAKEKEKESNNNYNNDESSRIAQAISQNSSFTELLTGGIGHNSNNSPTAHHHHHHHQNCNGEHVLFHKAAAHQQQMDYSFGSSSLLGLSPTPARTQHQFSGQIHLGNSLPAQTLFSISGDHHHHRSSSHPEMQHFSFVPDYIPVSAAANGGDYNLNFSMSMSSSGGLAGFNGGTLQSNSSSSPSLLSQLQRFSPMESNVPFFIGAAAAPTMENHHHHHQHQHQHHQFPAGLQLYGDGSRHSDHKGKAKN